VSKLTNADLAVLRERLAKMTDNELNAYARTALAKCRSEGNRTEPLSPFEMLVGEIEVEWSCRRRPKRTGIPGLRFLKRNK
jgi:hypothetical protein